MSVNCLEPGEAGLFLDIIIIVLLQQKNAREITTPHYTVSLQFQQFSLECHTDYKRHVLVSATRCK